MGCAAFRDDKDRVISVLLLGLDKSGKTTFLLALEGTEDKDDLSYYEPTKNLLNREIDRDKFKMRFYEIGGTPDRVREWNKFFAISHCIFYFIDVQDGDKYKESLKQLRDVTSNKENLETAIFIFINKIDQARQGYEDSLTRQIRQTMKDAKQFYKIYSISCIEKTEKLAVILDEISKLYFPTCVLKSTPVSADIIEKKQAKSR